MKFLINKIILKSVEIITEILLVLMTLTIFYQVILRFFFKKTPFWSEEISLVMMVWFGLLGATLGVRDDIHINVSFLIDLFPKKVQKAFSYINNTLLLCFCGVMTAYSYKLINLTRFQTLPATHLTVSITYLPLLISGILIILYTFSKLVNKFKSDLKK